MSVLPEIPEQLTTAEVNGHLVEVHQPHRRWTAADYTPGAPLDDRYEAVAVTVNAPISLSLDDVVAVLVDWNMPERYLADDDRLRELLASTVVGFGSLHIEELRCRLGERVLDAAAAAYLAYCRQRVTTVFGTGALESAGVLVGVR